MTNRTKSHPVSKTLMKLMALMVPCAFLMLTTGCQPQTRTGGGLFGFANRSNLNTNSAFNSSSFNNPFGGFAGNNPGQSNQSGAFSPSSPFGQFAQSSGTFRPGILGSNAGNTNPFSSNSAQTGQLGQLPQPGMAQEFGRINQQLGAYDADNQLLNTEVATLKQKLELANQYNQTLKQQISDTSDRITQSGNQQKINQQQFAGMQQQVEQLQRRIADQDRLLAQRTQNNAQNWQRNGNSSQDNGGFQSGTFQRDSGTFRNTGFNSNGGSATIRANNGLMQKLNSINIPGGDARMDGDIIRVEFPTDRLFTSGSYRVQPAQLPSATENCSNDT